MGSTLFLAYIASFLCFITSLLCFCMPGPGPEKYEYGKPRYSLSAGDSYSKRGHDKTKDSSKMEYIWPSPLCIFSHTFLRVKRAFLLQTVVISQWVIKALFMMPFVCFVNTNNQLSCCKLRSSFLDNVAPRGSLWYWISGQYAKKIWSRQLLCISGQQCFLIS